MWPKKKNPSGVAGDGEVYDPVASYRERMARAVPEDVPETAGAGEDVVEEQGKGAAPAPAPAPTEGGGKEVEVVCEGAICRCNMGKAPGRLSVVSQFKVYCNGGRKLVGTIRDRNFLSLSFGSCTAKNNAPCTPQVTWENFAEKVWVCGFPVLTLESKGLCGAGGGQIEFETSGQSQWVSSRGISALEMARIKSEYPFFRVYADAVEEGEEDSPGDGSPPEDGSGRAGEPAGEGLPELLAEAVSGMARGRVSPRSGIVPVTYPVEKEAGEVRQPRGVACGFHAAGKGSLTWRVRDDRAKVLREAEGPGGVSVVFPKYGRYVVEAYGFSSTLRKGTRVSDVAHFPLKYFNALVVDVSPNEIVLKAKRDRLHAGGSVEVDASCLFKGMSPGVGGLSYEVWEGNSPVGPDRAKVVERNGGCTVTFGQPGGYVVSGKAPGKTYVKHTGIVVVEALRVVSVEANGESRLSTYPGSPVELEAHLNFPDCCPAPSIHWEVEHTSPSGVKTVTHSRPSPTGFVPGSYTVYAFVKEKNEHVKALVKVGSPSLQSIKWFDSNGAKTRLVGCHEKVYAHVSFNHGSGLSVSAHLRTALGGRVLADCRGARMHGEVLVVGVGPLSAEVCRRLQEGQALSLGLETDLALAPGRPGPEKYPVEFSSKSDVVSLAFYADRECRKPVSSAGYGSTVYARVATRNLAGGEVCLNLGRELDWSGGGLLQGYRAKLDDNGLGVFEVKVQASWARKDGVWQKSGQFVAVVSELGGGGYREKLTPGKDSAVITFTDKPAEAGAEWGLTKVKKYKSEAGSCGGKYCIKLGDKSELIREINIRLAGFGGNVPTDEFTVRTEKMIKQFQRDYMKVPETGKICGNVLRAIDEFSSKWHENISEYTCLCENIKSITNKCTGFGKGRYKNEYTSSIKIERYHKYERPGIHRSLLWGTSALRFYLSQQNEFKYLWKTAGYRCWEHNNSVPRKSTNHMGKAVDIQFSKNGVIIKGKKESNIPLLKDLNERILKKYLNVKYQWIDGKNNFSIEPIGTAKDHTYSWIHLDVREFENKYLDDKYFVKTQNLVIGKSIIQLAQELDHQNLCMCNNTGFKPEEKKKEEAKNQRVDPKTLKTSDKGMEFIKDWELFKPNLYNDDSDEHHCTIGYGHLVHRGPCNGNEPEEFKEGITKKRALELFKLRLPEFEKAVQRDVTVPLYQYEFDALVSFLFNCGENFFLKKKAPKLHKHLLNKEYEAAAEEMLDVTSGGLSGLVKRRKAENNMFLNNIYDSTH